jgi:hypothetical protein
MGAFTLMNTFSFSFETFIKNMSEQIPLAVLLVVVLILIGIVLTLSRRITLLTRGQKGGSLEDSIRSIETALREEQTFKREMQTYLTGVEKRLRTSARGIGVVRYNAFAGTGSGGQQSFSVAYVAENGTGIIITTITARERVSVFAKPIKQFTADRELLPEEAEALAEARRSLAV